MPRRCALLAVVAAAALIAGGCAAFNVTKQVVPEGASTGPFTVHIDCQSNEDASAPSDEPQSNEPQSNEPQSNEPQIEGQQEQAEPEDPDPANLTPDLTAQETDDLVFNGPGTQLSEDFFDESTCIITEPQSAGALRVTFACTGVTPPELAAAVTCTNIANGLQVVVGDIGDSPSDQVTIDILVINDFTVTDPAAAVAATPTFTG